MLLERAGEARPAEIDKVFDKRLLRVGDDLVRGGGAVIKAGTGTQRRMAVVRHEFAFSREDVFDRVIPEPCARDPVMRVALLKPAAYHRARRVLGRMQVQVIVFAGKDLLGDE